MFNPKDFIEYENNGRDKRFRWCGLSVYCWLVSQTWHMCIVARNNDAGNELGLCYTITQGLECTNKNVAIAMESMFGNKHHNAYHKLVYGVLNGESANGTLVLGVE